MLRVEELLSHSSGCFVVHHRNNLWEDDERTFHRISQGEGGEQGETLMPLLFSVGQHRALEASHRGMNPGEFLMAFHDDVYMAIPLARDCLCTHASGCITGRLRCGTLQRLQRTGAHCRTNHPETVVWTRSTIPTVDQGIKVLGTPIGHQDFVAAMLKGTRGFARQNTVHQRCPERMVVACPLRLGTSVVLPQGPQTVSGGGIRVFC